MLLSFAGLTGCEKFLEVPLPIDQLATEDVFSTRPTILAAADGMYNIMGSGVLYANYNRFTTHISDEGLIDPIPGSDLGQIIAANISEGNTNLVPWTWFYPAVYRANEILERLPDVPTSVMPEAEKKTILGAAKYVRAAQHFLLANTWGDIPLTLTTKAQDNIENGRTPAAQVYAAVIKDLEEAVADLPATVNINNPRTIHNRFQAQALLARVYLYQKDWAKAEAAATAVINSGQYQLVTGVNNVFRRNSRETIFAFGPTGTGLLFENRAVVGWLTLPASAAQTTTTNCHIPALTLANFEPGDQRNVSGNWTINLFNRTFSNKYLHATSAQAAAIAAAPQDYIYQRLAEVYLIRAEARAQQGNVAGAAADLNAVRTRAGLGNTPAAAQADMLAAIEKERITELFYEGHRWYDLKRTGKLNTVLSALPWKKDNYKPHMELMPIVISELTANPRIQQNPGY